MRRKLFGRQSRSYFEESKRFQPQIFEWDNVYLEGYWQSEKYFPDVTELLREELSLESVRKNRENGYGLSAQAESYLQQMERGVSVSIHVRRGDYLLPKNQELYGNICAEQLPAHSGRESHGSIRHLYDFPAGCLFISNAECG